MISILDRACIFIALRPRLTYVPPRHADMHMNTYDTVNT